MKNIGKLQINGPILVTIKGSQGVGKTLLSKEIALHLESLNIATISYDQNTRGSDRRWRKPFAAEVARVMIIEKRSKKV